MNVRNVWVRTRNICLSVIVFIQLPFTLYIPGRILICDTWDDPIVNAVCNKTLYIRLVDSLAYLRRRVCSIGIM